MNVFDWASQKDRYSSVILSADAEDAVKKVDGFVATKHVEFVVNEILATLIGKVDKLDVYISDYLPGGSANFYRDPSVAKWKTRKSISTKPIEPGQENGFPLKIKGVTYDERTKDKWALLKY